jgi:hypothetical protein
MGNSVLQALPKQNGSIAHSHILDLESEIPPKDAADSESVIFMATDPQKEAETSLSSTSPFPARIGSETIFVISLLLRYRT